MTPTAVHTVDERLMVAMADAVPGTDGARAIFGAIIGADVISLLVAPLGSRQMPHALQPLLESGILPTAVAAVGPRWPRRGWPTRIETVAAGRTARWAPAPAYPSHV